MSDRTVWIAPGCPVEVERIVRTEAASNGDQVFPLNRRATDEKTVAERKWRAPIKPRKEQKPADIGLFSDDRDQSDMFGGSR